jgi:hypothetical protein
MDNTHGNESTKYAGRGTYDYRVPVGLVRSLICLIIISRFNHISHDSNPTARNWEKVDNQVNK